MRDINTILGCLSPLPGSANLRRLELIVEALYSMTGRVTMLGISRWTEAGCSYRTIQCFFDVEINWMKLHLQLVLMVLGEGVILLAGDETTVTKSGKKTYGLGRYFSSIYDRAVPSLSFLSFAGAPSR